MWLPVAEAAVDTEMVRVGGGEGLPLPLPLPPPLPPPEVALPEEQRVAAAVVRGVGLGEEEGHMLRLGLPVAGGEGVVQAEG